MMKNRYDGRAGKESKTANASQNRLQSEHNANDAFVKKTQNAQAKHGGEAPALKAEAMHFNAYQCNNGMHAQSTARSVTQGLDKTAFPVK
jgi:hypothetical protein